MPFLLLGHNVTDRQTDRRTDSHTPITALSTADVRAVKIQCRFFVLNSNVIKEPI